MAKNVTSKHSGCGRSQPQEAWLQTDHREIRPTNAKNVTSEHSGCGRSQPQEAWLQTDHREK